MIKLQPNLKPVQESIKQEQLPILQDIKNESNNILKPATKMLQPSTYLVAEERRDGAARQDLVPLWSRPRPRTRPDSDASLATPSRAVDAASPLTSVDVTSAKPSTAVNATLSTRPPWTRSIATSAAIAAALSLPHTSLSGKGWA